MIARAGDRLSAEQADALAQLCRLYWYPVYVYIRRTGAAPDDAQDLTQSFFAWLLESHLVAKATATRGRFRSFLLGVARRFLDHERQKTAAIKRGGGRPLISWDEPGVERRYLSEPIEHASPEKLFDRAWARALLERVVAGLREPYERSGAVTRFEKLEAYLPGGDTDPPPYGETASVLDMSEGALRVEVHRLRRKFRTLLRTEIAHTVDTPKDVDEELRYLITALST